MTVLTYLYVLTVLNYSAVRTLADQADKPWVWTQLERMIMADILDNPVENKTVIRLPRDLRYRNELFPDADNLVFKTSEKGFVPLPIIMRKVIRYLSSPEIRVLVYLHLRASRYGICYPATEEIVHELGLTSKKNLLPHIESLTEKQLISVRTNANRTFYLIHDPRVAIAHLAKTGEIKDDDLFEINDLYADLNQPQMKWTAKQNKDAK